MAPAILKYLPWVLMTFTDVVDATASRMYRATHSFALNILLQPPV